MKKFLKVLAAAAAVASVIPVRNRITENSGRLEALLWKATWDMDPTHETRSDINVTVGFNNIFRPADEEEIFADELVVDYCCDSTLQNTVPPYGEPCCCEECCAEPCCETAEPCCCGENAE